MPIKLLHTADVHLDAPFRWLGNKGKEQRRQVKDTFRALIDLALAERVDAVLIAGDLFDGNSPSQDAVDFVKTQLARLSVPVFIVPGTHDCYDTGSIYRRVHFATGNGAAVHVFDGARTAVELSTLGLTVHANANLTKTSRVSPLHGLQRNPRTRYNVALAHGSLARPGTEDDFPLNAASIAASGMDYLALGHWHSCQDCSAGGIAAWYSGPPELLTAEGEQGYVLLIELDEQRTHVQCRQVGRRRYAELSLPLDGIDGAEAIGEPIRSRRDPDLALTVRLSGLRRLDLVYDVCELEQELSPLFFALRVEDVSHPHLRPEDVEALSDKLVIGQFARRMQALIAEAADPNEKRVRECALQLGLALLQGKKVL